MGCLDENDLAAYLAREASGDEVVRIESHLATCDACRGIVEDAADLGQASTLAQAAASSPAASPLDRGTTVGRYVLLRVLGEGGFGIVYAAHDPTLDRAVALKLLRAGVLDGNPDAKARFVREAQAMARIEDPHVVTVHDAGEIDGRLFLAMELFDGRDLRAWLRAERRPVRGIVRTFVHAARGLAAAHAAGIVHRDFKPANVLLRKDGRVGVTDFGLAKGLGDEASGDVAGTPAYMAPEQLRGEPATPASDQFAFSVALAEALCRKHPFAAPDGGVRELTAAVLAGRRRSPLPRTLPRRLRRALDRGLSLAPRDRFASMADLIDALAPDRRLPLVGLGIGGALALAIGAGGAYHQHRAHLCEGEPTRMNELWNAETRRDVARAFAASELPYADEASRTFARRLDAYTARWSTLSTDACVATRIRGDQSEDALDARAACLERARVEVRTLLDDARALGTGASPSSAHVAEVGLAAASLRDLSECEDSAALLAQVKPPSAIRGEVASVRAALAEAHARLGVGQVARSDAMVGEAQLRAQSLGHAPLLAETFLASGVAAARRGEHEAAEKALGESLRAASRGRHDRAAAEAWVELVYVAGVLRGAPETGLALRAGALAALDRIGSSRAIAARLASASGSLEANLARFDAATRDHRDAVRLYAEAGGAEAPEIGPELSHVAEMLCELGRWDEAAVTAEQARARTAAAFGEHHPTTALPLTLLARRACVRGDGAGCERLVDRAMIARTTPTTRPDDPTFLPMLLVHAQAMNEQSRAVDAEADLSRARTIADAAFGPSSSWAGLVGAAIGEALLARREPALALEALRESVRILDRTERARHPDGAAARIGVGSALVALGRTKEALATLDEAQASLAAVFGEDSPRLAAPLLVRAQALRADGRIDEARRQAEAAVRASAAGETVASREARDLVKLLAK